MLWEGVNEDLFVLRSEGMVDGKEANCLIL